MATYTIKSGHVLTLVTDALTTAKYTKVLDPNNTTAVAVSSLAVSSTAVIGPFPNERRYEVLSKGDGITATDTLFDLSGVAHIAAFVADITNSATGTQIATAVNGIKAALVAADLMASS